MDNEALSRFELTAQKLVYGGGALGYHAGHTVLVAGVLPGERVEAEALRQAKGVVHARLRRVIEPSAERTAPPCPYFGRCGGCHYQHLEATRQSEVKREILRETLQRIGRIEWPGEIAVHAADPWHYRNQVRLQLGRRDDGQAALGFFEANSHRLAPIDACLICSPRLNAILGELGGAQWMARLQGCSELVLLADQEDEQVMLTLYGAGFADAEKLAGECMASLPGVVGVRLEPGAPRPTPPLARPARPLARRGPGAEILSFGKPRLRYRVGGYEYEITPGSFFQASRFLLPQFVNALTSYEGRARSLALDLHAGVGLFTLPLAHRFHQVAAVEAHPQAAADLAHNVRCLGNPRARAVATTAAEFLRRYAQAAPDLVVVDPPRAGVDASALQRLAEIAPACIHYASCHPPALARDLALLLGRGYRLESMEMFDLFPQTFHIEAVAKLYRA
ncbi:MAG TPA: 23S rRNA (uracil(1939)-C(5))-methyltransferase RlmD [Terriglobia bacterium]|nr:23S rRNA (uracil(1939)-C(5))-methyltransferase RlmD [Terriglobia bacterium]